MRSSVIASLLVIVAATAAGAQRREPVPVRVMVNSSMIGPLLPDTAELRRIFSDALGADSLVRVLPIPTFSPRDTGAITAENAARLGRIPGARFGVTVSLSGGPSRMTVVVRAIDIESTRVGLRDSVVVSAGEDVDAAVDRIARRTALQLAQIPPTRQPLRVTRPPKRS